MKIGKLVIEAENEWRYAKGPSPCRWFTLFEVGVTLDRREEIIDHFPNKTSLHIMLMGLALRFHWYHDNGD